MVLGTRESDEEEKHHRIRMCVFDFIDSAKRKPPN